MPDVVVVGAGVIGAACAEALGRHGLQVSVYDRGGPASATTASGEGNVLVSDKSPGPELTLARASRRRWPELLAELAELTDAAELTGTGAELTGTGDSGPSDSGPGDAEWEAKGGLVVATAPESADALAEFAATQRAAGVDARTVSATEAAALEPHLTSELAYAVHYPEDGQLNPVAATTALLAGVRQRGGEVVAGVTVTGVLRTRHGAVQGVRTSAGPVSCGAVVNACGPWAGQFAARLGLALAVTPRRGNVLVTAPVPGLVRHKVYDADYVGAVASGEAGVRTSAVVESTRAGTVLIGSSRERVGFDDTIRIAVVRQIAARAIRLFPVLAGVPVMRMYGGFRPYTPDHLPVIGPDPRLSGLWHATGHEGAGIGLAPVTGELLAELFTGAAPRLDPEPFRVDRPAIVATAA